MHDQCHPPSRSALQMKITLLYLAEPAGAPRRMGASKHHSNGIFVGGSPKVERPSPLRIRPRDLPSTGATT